MAAQTSTRKQWRLCRGPEGNVHSLGWAEFGCPDSQLSLAKELLRESQDTGTTEEGMEESTEREEKARLGVYWLLKASEKGHAEATALLSECLRNGTGITEQNLNDVKMCLEMPQGEKLSREAAKDLFLSLSQGENYITCSQLMKEIFKFAETPPMVDAGAEGQVVESGNRRKLTEEMMMTAGERHYHGELPWMLLESGSLRAGSRRMSRCPLAVASISLSSLPFLPPHSLLLIPVLCLTTLSAYVSLLYYLSLLLMVLSTSRIITNSWRFNLFKQWSVCLVSRGCSKAVSEQAQWAYLSANSTPFFVFFLSLAANLCLTTYAQASFSSEVAVLSLLLSLFVLHQFARTKRKADYLLITTFVLHAVGRYPYEEDTLFQHYWSHLDIHTPTFISYTLGESMEVYLNVRVLVCLMVPGLLLKMALRDGSLGIYSSLLPSLVSFSWWQLFISASSGATEFGMLRSCLGLVLVGVLLPISSITLLLLPLFVFTKFLITHQLSLWLAFLFLSVISLALYGLKYKISRRMFCFLQLSLSAGSVAFILMSWREPGLVLPERPMPPDTDWRDISRLCGEVEELERQQNCVMLIGLPVSGRGTILSVSQHSLHNPLLSLLPHIPLCFQESVICLLGEKYKPCTNEEGCDKSSRKCTISNWNKYTYSVKVELATGESEGLWMRSKESTDIELELLGEGQDFRQYCIQLVPGNTILFTGLLEASGAADRKRELRVRVTESDSGASLYRPQQPLSAIYSSLSALFTFLFYPLSLPSLNANPFIESFHWHFY